MADVTPDDTQRDASTAGDTAGAAGDAQAGTSQPPEATPASAAPSPPAEPPLSEEPLMEEPLSEAPAPEEPSGAGEPAAAIPEVESTTTVAPLGAAAAGNGEGGEWELLLAKLRAWLESGQIQTLWRQSKSPLTLALAAVGVLLLLRVYAGLLAVIESLPLVPGLLELVGVIYAVRVGLPRLVQRSRREELIQALQQRWDTFVGRS